ncbi:hypothetical protein LTR94_032919, partial [Friedmanniomyces endolithicus]
GGAGARRQGLFRLHRRRVEADRQIRPRSHDGSLRPGPRRSRRARFRSGAGDRLRGIAALHAAQVGGGHALSARQPHPLGQASAGGRRPGLRSGPAGRHRTRRRAGQRG